MASFAQRGIEAEQRIRISTLRRDRSKMYGSQKMKETPPKIVVSVRLKTLSQHLENVLQEIKFKFFHVRQMANIAKAKMFLKISFWAVIYLVGSFLTFNPCFHLIQQYWSNTTSTQIINMMNNTNMTVPIYTMCLPNTFFTFDPIDVFDTSELYSKAMDEFFNETTAQDFFEINSTGIYSDEVYTIIWMYLAMIYEAEFSPELQKNPFASLNQSGDDFMAMKNILLPKIELYNITIDQLKSVFDGKLHNINAQAYCFVSFQLSDCLGNSVSECVSSKNISFIGSNEICFTFNEQKSTLDSCGNINDLIWNLQYVDTVNNTAAFNITVDFAGKGIPPTDLSITQKENSVIMLTYKPPLTIFIISINVLAVTQNLPKLNGVVQCSENLTPNDCLNDCISQFISRNCDCIPMILPSTAQRGAEKCSFETYANRLNYSIYEDNDYLICKAACLPSCQTWHYVYETTNWQISPRFREKYLQFEFSTFDYVIFQESKESFGDFMSALGGALAIWLGLDIVILIQFIWQPVMLMIRRCLAKIGTNDEDNRVVEVNENQVTQTYLKKLKKLFEKHATAHGKGTCFVWLWIFETIFWAVIYATGGVYTAYYSVTLCLQYLSEETHSHASLMFNKSITLPPATLCVATCDLQDMNCSIFTQFENIALVERKEHGGRSYSKLLESQFSNTSINKTSFLSSVTPWSPAVLYIASLYVGILQITESYAMSSDSNFTSVHYPDNSTIKWIYDNYFSDDSTLDEQNIQALPNRSVPTVAAS